MKESATREILEKVLGLADAEAVTATLEGETSDFVRFSDNAITQNSRRTDLSLSLSCAYGQRHASASTNDLSEESLKDLVKRAQAAARISPPDPEYMPPVEAGESVKYLPVDAYFEKTIAFDPEARAKAISRTIGLVESKGFRLSGAFISTGGYHALANSAGLRAYFRSTEAEIHTTVLAKDGSGWAQSNSNNVDLVDPEKAASEALSIAVDSQGPTDIEPGKYTVILRPAAVEEMIPRSMICDAKETDEGRTFLRGKLATKVCGNEITIRSDPSLARCPGSPFQGEGLALP
jgi:predicted Zn-dependent protease